MDQIFNYFTIIIGSIMIIFGLVFGYYLTKGYGARMYSGRKLVLPKKAKVENKLVLLAVVCIFIIGGVLMMKNAFGL